MNKLLSGLFGLLLMSLLTACQTIGNQQGAESVGAYQHRGQQAFNKGQYDRARQSWNKGLVLARAHAQVVSEANFLLNLARLDELTGHYSQALQQAQDVAGLTAGTENTGLYIQALLQQGQVLRRLSRYDEAMSVLERALSEPRTASDPVLRCDALRYKAALWQDMGNIKQAQTLYVQALQLAKLHNLDASEAAILNNLGLIRNSQAEYHQAIELFGQSLKIRQAIADKPGQSKVLGNLCITYTRLNQFDQALRNCNESLAIARRLGDRQREVNNLNNIGAIYRYDGDNENAIKYYQKALPIKKELGDKAGQARVLNNLGEIKLAQGNLKQAEADLKSSLAIKTGLHDIAGQSASHQNLALLERRRDNLQQAVWHYQQALILNSQARRPEHIWRTFDGLSVVYQQLSQQALAIFYGKQALNTIQKTRADIAKLSKPSRQSYLRNKERVYHRVADLLIQAERLAEARQVIQMLKEEEYANFLVRGDADQQYAEVATTIPEQEWMQRYQQIATRLGEIGYRIEQLERERRTGDFTDSKKQELKVLYEDADVIQQAFEDYLDKLKATYLAMDREEVSRFSQKTLDNLQTMQGILADMQQPTVILSYLVMHDKVAILLTSSTVQIARESGIQRSALNKLVFDYKELLTNPHKDPSQAGKQLYGHLISPVAKELKDLHVKTLMISLDGALRYLPMAALNDGQRYLVEDYNLSLYAPAAKTQFQTGHKTAWKVAGLGLSDRIEGFNPLPAVGKELDLIVKEDRPEDKLGILPGKVMINQTFTEDSLADMLGEGFPVIHLASHFVFRPGAVDDSFILLGNGKQLTLADLRGRQFPFKFIDLLTLSACETAVGGEDAQGREVESFAKLALDRGTGSILATLWPVADQSTGDFMQRFYQTLEQQDLSRAAALRKVQLQFIHGNATGAVEAGDGNRGGVPVANEGDYTPDPKVPYAHPYYWAPFILIGNFL